MRAGAAMPSPFQPGAIVIVYLREPRERVCGMLLSLDAVGIALAGMDVGSFQDWLRARLTRSDEIAASHMFYPMARVERVLMDEGTVDVPGLDAQCVAVTGRTMRENLSDETRASSTQECAS